MTEHRQGWQVRCPRFFSRPGFRGEHRFGVFPQLIGRLEELVVAPVVVVFAIIRRISSTDLRSREVDSATIVGHQILTIAENQEKPRSTIDKNRRSPVHDVPPHVVEVLPCRWSFDGECEIAATASRTIRAQHFAGFKIRTPNFHFCHD